MRRQGIKPTNSGAEVYGLRLNIKKYIEIGLFYSQVYQANIYLQIGCYSICPISKLTAIHLNIWAGLLESRLILTLG